jgi:NRAMP (natural resistance-associated macrophage protein)-like metal ion transporter
MALRRAAMRTVGKRLWRRGAVSVRRTMDRRRSVWDYLRVVGPGILAANAGNDAGGITTYSVTGAEFGYRLLWVMIPIAIGLWIVQEMCARMGAVTGKGLSDLIREQFGVRWTALVMFTLLIANTGVTISEFVGIASATELLGIPRFISVPIAALCIWWIVVKGTYKHVERVFLIMSTVFLAYIVSTFMARPSWHEVGRGFITPSFSIEYGYIFTIIALVGTTISPYMQVFVQSSVVDKGVTEDDYPLTRLDVLIGTIFSMTISIFIMICTAATLNKSGIRVESAVDAASALAPLAGQYALILFAVGLFGASMLAAGVLPLSTAYSISEALGFEKGISRSFREAPIFLGIFTFLICVGAVVTMLPNINLFRVLLGAQVINGLLLPIILFTVLRLAGDRELMGNYANSRVYHIAAWCIAIMVSVLSLSFIILSFL